MENYVTPNPTLSTTITFQIKLIYCLSKWPLISTSILTSTFKLPLLKKLPKYNLVIERFNLYFGEMSFFKKRDVYIIISKSLTVYNKNTKLKENFKKKFRILLPFNNVKTIQLYQKKVN